MDDYFIGIYNEVSGGSGAGASVVVLRSEKFSFEPFR